MVAAAKAHRLVQQQQQKHQPQAQQPPAEQQQDGNVLLQMWEEKMDRGLPDEALQLASAAVDIFFNDGDKAGESRALSYVAQAMAWGATLQKSEGVTPSIELGSSGAQERPSIGFGNVDTRNLDTNNVGDGSSSLGLTDLTELPISYGERLILETCMRSRQRPYDRERQEALSRPRKRGGAAQTWMKDGAKSVSVSAQASETERSLPNVSGGSSSAREPSARESIGASSEASVPVSARSQEARLSTAQTDSLVSRLSQPKKNKQLAKAPAEQLLLRSQDRSSKLKTGGVDIVSIVARLSAPRPGRALSPTPGERVVLMWNRSENQRKPDYERLNQMAKSSRRGGSAQAWGVKPWMEASQQLSTEQHSSWLRKPEALYMAPDHHRHTGYLPDHKAQDASPRSGGVPGPEATLPPLSPNAPEASAPQRRPGDGHAPELAQAKASPPQRRPAEGHAPDTSQDAGHTWHHPWRSGVDKTV